MNILPYAQLVNPAVANCGDTFEALELESWIKDKAECPSCGKELTSSVPNIALIEILNQQAIEKQEGGCALVDETGDKEKKEVIERIQKIIDFLMESQFFAISHTGGKGGIALVFKEEFTLTYEEFKEKLYAFPSKNFDSCKESSDEFASIRQLKKIQAQAQFLAESRYFEIDKKNSWDGSYTPDCKEAFAYYYRKYKERCEADSDEMFVILPIVPDSYDPRSRRIPTYEFI